LKHVQNTYKDCLPKPKKKTPAKHNKNSEAIKLQNNNNNNFFKEIVKSRNRQLISSLMVATERGRDCVLQRMKNKMYLHHFIGCFCIKDRDLINAHALNFAKVL